MAPSGYSCLIFGSPRGGCARICAVYLYIYIYICDFARGLRRAMRQKFLTKVEFLTQLLRLAMGFSRLLYVLFTFV